MRLDRQTDNKTNNYNNQCLYYIENHLNRFYYRYANENGLTLDQASRQINRWDLNQWQQAVNQININGSWPQPAINRVAAYTAVAHVNKGHMINAIIALGLIANTVHNFKAINNRILNDGKTQVQRLRRYLRPTKQVIKKVSSIITQASTQAKWSKNLWSDTDKLANDVEALVNKHIRHGMSLKDMDSILTKHANPNQFSPSQSLADRVSQMDYNAQRIVRTESSRLIDEVNMTTYQQSNVQLVDWVTMPGACQLCLAISDDSPYSVWSAPSIPDDSHPNCRCIKIPHNNPVSNLITPNMLF